MAASKSTGADRDASDRIEPDRARTRLGTPTAPLGEHLRGALLPAGRRRGRRALRRLEKLGRDGLAGRVVPEAARPEPRVVAADEPDDGQRHREGQPGERQEVERSELGRARSAPHEQEEEDDRRRGDGEAQYVELQDQGIVGARRSGREVARRVCGSS